MRILTWNLNSRVKAISDQIGFIASLDADVVTLQEIRKGSREQLATGLVGIGLPHVLNTVLEDGTGQRQYGVMIASRYPLSAKPLQHPPEWPERVLVATVHGVCPITVLTTYVPPGEGKDGPQKVSTLESVYREAATCAKGGPTVLTGDFNAPREEGEHGVLTWAQAQRKDGSWGIRRSRGVGWDTAERAFFCREHFRDAHREANGWESAYTWVAKRGGKRWERRFDHIFVSPHWQVKALSFHHQVVADSLSDHSAVVADIELSAAQSANS